MNKTLLYIGIGVIIVGGMIYVGQRGKMSPVDHNPPNELRHQINDDGSVSLGNKLYYVVKAGDPSMDTGDAVCASVGKKCVGYTDFSVTACLAFHSSAAVVSDLDGAKAGFYCDGPPVGGVCGREKNTCHICPKCNINMDCQRHQSDLYTESFVECI
jgi:hypothetical protein